MSEVRRVCGPYQVSDGAWRLIEQAVSARLGSEALVSVLMAQAVPCPRVPSWIYFLRDDLGEVIYVGVTGKIGDRLDSHLVDGKSFASVSIVPAVFERSAALEIERLLVRSLKPRLNIHHNPDPESPEPGSSVQVHVDQTENDAS